ncbi:MAG: PIN/TRAM domain-containing protein [Acetivibrionales bacterium]|jgi:uncharacterized protein YacL
MLEKILKYAFGLTGALTGISLVRLLMIQNGVEQYLGVFYGVGAVVAVILGVIMFHIGGRIIVFSSSFVDRIEASLQKITLYELMIGSGGLIAGLVIANLISIPIVKIELIGVPLSIMINILFGICGIYFTVVKKNENIFEGVLGKKKGSTSNGIKLLDTSAIIDGRILDLSRTGFLEGELVIPGFVLEELRHLADSADDIVRAKGRRGLDVLNMLKSDAKFPITIDKSEGDSQIEVDEQLLTRAKEMGAKVITNDYNLGKVAAIRGIGVLNINDLANSMKPVAVSGEEMTVRIVKEGKESGQGVGYLDDGTMVVVEQAYKFKGQLVDVVVVSVLQTSAGRMVFGKFKNVHLSLVN